VYHWGFGPPWIGFHGRPEKLIEAQPMAAPGHNGLL
jgi:hypothetical protein